MKSCTPVCIVQMTCDSNATDDQGGIKYFTSWEPILSDTTEGIQNCGNLGIKYVVYTFIFS